MRIEDDGKRREVSEEEGSSKSDGLAWRGAHGQISVDGGKWPRRENKQVFMASWMGGGPDKFLEQTAWDGGEGGNIGQAPGEIRHF